MALFFDIFYRTFIFEKYKSHSTIGKYNWDGIAFVPIFVVEKSQLKHIIRESKVWKVLAQPMKAGEGAEATGIDKKEGDKIIKKLVAEGKVESPKRCYYAAKN